MNKTMLITGASRGIGKAITIHFAKKGYELILVSRSEEDLNAITLECKSLGTKAYNLFSRPVDFLMSLAAKIVLPKLKK